MAKTKKYTLKIKKVHINSANNQLLVMISRKGLRKLGLKDLENRKITLVIQ